MKQLPVMFKKNCLVLEQLKRSEKTALYALKGTETGPTIGYEVWKITIDEARMSFGKPQPEQEHVPGNEEFGTLGFSWCTKEQAEKCYAEMEGRKEEAK